MIRSLRRKGGEGSEAAAAFLSNFMPINPAIGDQRRFSSKLVFGDRKQSSTHRVGMSTIVFRDDEILSAGQNYIDILKSEIPIYVAPISESVGFSFSRRSISAAQAAREIVTEVEANSQIRPWIDWLIFSAVVLLTAVGVGVTIGMIRAAATTGIRLLATAALVFETADGTEYITGFIGGKAQGYNPLKAAFRNLGTSANGASGAKPPSISTTHSISALASAVRSDFSRAASMPRRRCPQPVSRSRVKWKNKPCPVRAPRKGRCSNDGQGHTHRRRISRT